MKNKTINSLSGGKTSSYLAAHYPADYNLFALVCNDDPSCAHPDKKVMQLVNDKLDEYNKIMLHMHLPCPWVYIFLFQNTDNT